MRKRLEFYYAHEFQIKCLPNGIWIVARYPNCIWYHLECVTQHQKHFPPNICNAGESYYATIASISPIASIVSITVQFNICLHYSSSIDVWKISIEIVNKYYSQIVDFYCTPVKSIEEKKKCHTTIYHWMLQLNLPTTSNLVSENYIMAWYFIRA